MKTPRLVGDPAAFALDAVRRRPGRSAAFARDDWLQLFLGDRVPLANSSPATPAPSSGATMNSQSWATAVGFEPAPTSAGPIERAGLTDTPVTLMPTI